MCAGVEGAVGSYKSPSTNRDHTCIYKGCIAVDKNTLTQLDVGPVVNTYWVNDIGIILQEKEVIFFRICWWG